MAWSIAARYQDDLHISLLRRGKEDWEEKRMIDKTL